MSIPHSPTHHFFSLVKWEAACDRLKFKGEFDRAKFRDAERKILHRNRGRPAQRQQKPAGAAPQPHGEISAGRAAAALATAAKRAYRMPALHHQGLAPGANDAKDAHLLDR